MEINIEKHKILNEYLINGFWLKMVDDEIDLKTLINTFNLNTGIKINSLTLEEAKKEIVNIIERLKNEPKYYLQKKKSIILDKKEGYSWSLFSNITSEELITLPMVVRKYKKAKDILFKRALILNLK